MIENSVQHSVTINQLELTRKSAAELGLSKQALDSEVQVLRSSLADAEKQVAVAERSINALDDKCQSLSSDLSKMKEQFKVVALERSEAADALRQTMRAARDLSMKYSQEKDLRIAADKTVEQLQRQSQTNIIADATLQALHQEKRKSAALQQSLSLVPLVLKWRLAAHPDRGSILSSLNDLKKSYGMHTIIHTYKLSCIHIYIQSYIHTIMQTYIQNIHYSYINTFIHTYIKAYIHTYIQPYIHTCNRPYIVEMIAFID